MAIDTRTDELEIAALAAEERVTPPRRNTSSAGSAFVAILVCLGLWALLLAPSLLRDAETGPVGTRRAVALAVLRPLAAVAERLSVDLAAVAVERALGRNPDERPGGRLELPSIELPRATGPEPAEPSPPSGDRRSEERPPGGTPAAESLGPDEPESPDVSIRVPEPGNELRVAVVGDSLSQGLGPAVTELFDPELARVLSLGRQSTGLARLDYFNWRAAMRQLVERFRPDLVFVMIGSNDDQAQIGPDGSAVEVGSTAWVQAYRSRAAQFLREATSAGTRVVWVGIPVVEERARWSFYRRVNGIYRETAEADPLAAYVDAWTLFQPKGGGYSAFLRNERGVLQQMRAPDGVHFTPTGYGYLARTAIRVAGKVFALPPQTVTIRV
jgi:hypothetical protein